MKKLIISGSSDDLVEIDGDFGDEHGSYDHPAYVELSTGDVFKVEYTKGGQWKVTHHVRPEKGGVETSLEPAQDDDDNYTDVMTCHGDIHWFEFWGAWPAPTKEKLEKVKRIIEDEAWTPATIEAVYQALTGRPRRRAS